MTWSRDVAGVSLTCRRVRWLYIRRCPARRQSVRGTLTAASSGRSVSGDDLGDLGPHPHDFADPSVTTCLTVSVQTRHRICKCTRHDLPTSALATSVGHFQSERHSIERASTMTKYQPGHHTVIRWCRSWSRAEYNPDRSQQLVVTYSLSRNMKFSLWQPPVGSYKYLVFVCILCVNIVFAYWK